MLLSISNCCAAINIYLFIYLFIYLNDLRIRIHNKMSRIRNTAFEASDGHPEPHRTAIYEWLIRINPQHCAKSSALIPGEPGSRQDEESPNILRYPGTAIFKKLSVLKMNREIFYILSYSANG